MCSDNMTGGEIPEGVRETCSKEMTEPIQVIEQEAYVGTHRVMKAEEPFCNPSR